MGYTSEKTAVKLICLVESKVAIAWSVSLSERETVKMNYFQAIFLRYILHRSTLNHGRWLWVVKQKL